MNLRHESQSKAIVVDKQTRLQWHLDSTKDDLKREQECVKVLEGELSLRADEE